MSELVDLFRASPSTIERWIARGWFPKGVKTGANLVWPQTDADAVMHLMGRGVWPPGGEIPEEK